MQHGVRGRHDSGTGERGGERLDSVIRDREDDDARLGQPGGRENGGDDGEGEGAGDGSLAPPVQEDPNVGPRQRQGEPQARAASPDHAHDESGIAHSRRS